jgi:hypothetical protein
MAPRYKTLLFLPPHPKKMHPEILEQSKSDGKRRKVAAVLSKRWSKILHSL